MEIGKGSVLKKKKTMIKDRIAVLMAVRKGEAMSSWG